MSEALVVVIAGEQYGVPMERVVEVRVHHRVAFLPGAPVWIRGFVSLYNRPVEVFDAARRLGRGELRLDAHSCIVFIETARGYAGMLVDGVNGLVPAGGPVPMIDLDPFFLEAIA